MLIRLLNREEVAMDNELWLDGDDDGFHEELNGSLPREIMGKTIMATRTEEEDVYLYTGKMDGIYFKEHPIHDWMASVIIDKYTKTKTVEEILDEW